MQLPTDPAWLDAQYNNRARVPAAPEHLARWTEASRLTRAASPAARLDLRYGDGPSETLDFFPAQPGAPVLVFLHGGYWRALDKSDFSFVAPSFVADGAAVVVVNYGLCPTVTVEQIALQCARAIAWTHQHAGELGVDASRLAVAGHSAGGHLAAMMLCCRWPEVAPGLPAQLMVGALSISGLYDLEPIRQTPFLQGDLRLTPASVKRLSPAFFRRPRHGVLLTVAGGDESEEYLRQNRLIRDQWGPTAVPVCEALPGDDHFSVLSSLADPGGRLHTLALGLMGLR